MLKFASRNSDRINLSGKKREYVNINLCDGIWLDKSFFSDEESRLKTLILKGVIVYLLTMGSIGSYLSAMDCKYSGLVLNIVLFATAIFCALLYYTYLVENVGYLIFFIFFIGLIMLFRDYINSGFYAIVNDTIEEASIYLNMEGMQHYNERISNRYLAITISMCFIGTGMNILLNVYIARRMQYIVATIIVMTLNLVPLYFEKEPDIIYSLMLIAGIVLTYMYKAGKHYRLISANSIYSYDEKKGIRYVYNYKSILQTLLIGFIFVFIVVSASNVFFPKNTFASKHADNKYKVSTMDTVSNILSLGLAGLFNYYPNTGGLTGGKLGGVSSIHLDYNTDIIVEYTPYSYDSIYLKNFTGQTYVPYENVWTQPEDIEENMNQKNKAEAEALKKAFDDDCKYSAKGYMKITNVEGELAEYLPYYSEESQGRVYLNKSAEYSYYPRLDGNDATVEKNNLPDSYLDIPEENYETIKTFCEKAGFSGTNQQIISQVTAYYQNNIPYTIRPGATPKKDDFINFFLEENKKGYCAHFASAATLIFRYYGIPARYIEGYAISYNELDDAKLIDEDFDKYYKGYSEIGKTGLVSVEVSDADAHAWVEVYDKQQGWIIADVTPAGGEEDTVDFWSTFQKFLDDGNNDNSGTYDGNAGGGFRLTISDSFVSKFTAWMLGAICLLFLAFALRFMIPVIKYRIDYKKAGINDKLIMEYSRFIKKLSKKNKELKTKMNYHTQIDYLYDNDLIIADEADKKEAERILSQAGFSDKNISEEQYEKMLQIIRNNRKIAANHKK